VKYGSGSESASVEGELFLHGSKMVAYASLDVFLIAVPLNSESNGEKDIICNHSRVISKPARSKTASRSLMDFHQRRRRVGNSIEGLELEPAIEF
jgi:hypothetical protein